MSLFLNTPRLNEWIPKLIKESDKEVIIIVPYIKLSDNILQSLKEANQKNIEMTLVYRENKLSATEKETLLSNKNLNLLHHPNIHAKCYYNGELLIIGSMNLYEYSEINNREMGVLLHKKKLRYDEFEIEQDDKKIFDDTILEVRDILRSSELERESLNTKNNGFELDIIKTDEEIEFEVSKKLNKIFLNKIFKPIKHKKSWLSKCQNYFDKIDVAFDGRRFCLTFNLPNDELEHLHNIWKKDYQEYEFEGFKYYWNYAYSDLLIYSNNKSSINWNNCTDEEYIRHFKSVIKRLIDKYRNLVGK